MRDARYLGDIFSADELVEIRQLLDRLDPKIKDLDFIYRRWFSTAIEAYEGRPDPYTWIGGIGARDLLQYLIENAAISISEKITLLINDLDEKFKLGTIDVKRNLLARPRSQNLWFTSRLVEEQAENLLSHFTPPPVDR